MVSFSVVICSHNRSASLLELLHSLSECDRQEFCIEFIIVASGCTDDTANVVTSFQLSHRDMNIFLYEKRVSGASLARGLGLKVTNNSDLLVYLDDDMTVSKCFFVCYSEGAMRFPSADIFAGQIKAIWPVGKPWWYPNPGDRKIDGVIGTFSPSSSAGLMNVIPFGGNMGFRKANLLPKVKFNANYGMNGQEMNFGEETLFCNELIEHGLKVAYLPEVVSNHHLQAAFLAKRYIFRRLYKLNKDAIVFGFMTSFDKDKSVLSIGWVFLKQFVFSIKALLLDRDGHSLFALIERVARYHGSKKK